MLAFPAEAAPGPSAPTGLSATAGDGQATVTFTAPASNGGDAVTGYTVTAHDSSTAANGGQTASGASSPITVTGLTNGDTYTFTVVATNSVSTGPASAASNSVTPHAAALPTLSGTVTDAGTASPLGNVCVSLWSGPSQLRTTCSGSDGTYSMTDVAPGTYTVSFVDAGGTHQTQWAGDATTQAASTPITLNDGAVTTDAAMAGVPGTISGTVHLNTYNPSTQECAYLYHPGADGAYAGQGTCTNESGQFLLSGMPPGTYVVAFSDPMGLTPTIWSGGAATQAAASTVAVAAAAATTGVDVAPTPASGSIVGRVFNADRSAGLANICVYDFAQEGNAATCTNAQGGYVLSGLALSTHYLAFVDPTGALPTQWVVSSVDGGVNHGETTVPRPVDGRGEVSLSSAPIAYESPSVLGGGSISGTVLDSSTKQPRAGACVYVDWWDGVYVGQGAVTDSNGHYTLTNLAPNQVQGTTFPGYRVGFYWDCAPDQPPTTVWNGGANDEFDASEIAVQSGVETTGIDATVVKPTVVAPITWDTPDPIGYGTPLGATQLNASSSVAGTFSYSPPVGTVLSVGQHTLSVTFTPTDQTTYQTTDATADLTVNPAATSTVLTASGSGRSVTLSATVTAPDVGSAVPPGSVQFLDGDTVVDTQTIDPSGHAETVVSLAPGEHSLTAKFLGSTNFAASTSTTTPLSVANNCVDPAEPGIDWTGCDLTGRNLTGVDLTGATLTSTNLTNVTLTGATLTGVRSGGITGTPTALPTSWSLRNGYLVGPGANLDGAVLTTNDPHYASRLDLHGVDLSNASLVGANLNGSEIWDANLTGANLTGANLFYSDFRFSNLTNVTLTNANLDATYLLYDTLTGIISGGITGTPGQLVLSDGSSWQVLGGYLIGPGANLTDANLTGLPFSGLDLTGTNLTGANLSGQDLTGDRFTDATLTNADLTGATLTGVVSGGIIGTPQALPTPWTLVSGYLLGPDANLSGADLTGLDFSGADFTAVDLTGATLTGTNLDQAKLADAILSSVTAGGITGTPASLPPGVTITNGYFVGTGADLHGNNYDGADLTGVDFSGSNLTGATFVGANLTGVNFSGSNLTNASLVNANLTGTQLGSATLNGLSSDGVVGTPASLPPGWRLFTGYLLGPKANLAHAILDGADLSGIDLSGANLERASLYQTNLSNATLVGTDLTEATSNNGTNLAGANLTGANLTRIDIRYGSLANATLTNANLSFSFLLYNTLTGVTSGGIIGTPADVRGADGANWQVVNGYLVPT